MEFFRVVTFVNEEAVDMVGRTYVYRVPGPKFEANSCTLLPPLVCPLSSEWVPGRKLGVKYDMDRDL